MKANLKVKLYLNKMIETASTPLHKPGAMRARRPVQRLSHSTGCYNFAPQALLWFDVMRQLRPLGNRKT